MKPPNHKYLFYTSANLLLFSSLQRYFKYILNVELNQLNETSLLSSTTLFVYHQEKENPELLNIIANNKNIKIILLGLDINCTINLLDFTNLKNNFISKLSEDSLSTTQLFTEDELKQKLKNFFHSHGEDSLFEYLNLTIYFLNNGIKQFLNDLISYDKYREFFIEPAIKNWNHFVNRYTKYKSILNLSSYQSILKELDNIVTNLNPIIIKLGSLNNVNIIRENEKQFYDSLENIKYLINILIKMKGDIYIGQ